MKGCAFSELTVRRIFQENKPLREKLRRKDTSLCDPLGSLTVEASLVLPFMIFFLVNILNVFDLIRTAGCLQTALYEAGTRMGEEAYYLTEKGGQKGSSPGTGQEGEDMEGAGSLGGPGSLVLSETYVRSSVRNFYGEDQLLDTCIEGGSGGISYLRSHILDEHGDITLVADYYIRPRIPVFAPSAMSMSVRYMGHAWVGEQGRTDASSSEKSEEEVYIVPGGEVYHRNLSCTYLHPHVRAVSARDLGTLRSEDGSKYYPCESCHPGRKGTVYVTSYGNRYHTSASCGQIHRDILTVPISQVGGRRACSKCGGP